MNLSFISYNVIVRVAFSWVQGVFKSKCPTPSNSLSLSIVFSIHELMLQIKCNRGFVHTHNTLYALRSYLYYILSVVARRCAPSDQLRSLKMPLATALDYFTEKKMSNAAPNGILTGSSTSKLVRWCTPPGHHFKFY